MHTCFLGFLIVSAIKAASTHKPTSSDKYQSVYYESWCSENGETDGYCEYLDDKYCQKVFPSKYYREFVCPNIYDSEDYIQGQGYLPTSDLSSIVVNESALTPYTSSDFYVTAILIRRNATKHPFYKYLSNGNANKVYQPWSSSKVFAIMNGASTLRQKCAGSSGSGLDSLESNTKYPLGDLITVIHSYHSDSPTASNPDYESNCLAGYFLNVGGRQQLDDNVHASWLGADNDMGLGGDYGCSDTYTLGYDFVNINDTRDVCELSDTAYVSLENSLSSLAAAEMYKRIIMVREEPQWSYPDITWTDTKNMLYGAETSVLFPDINWGGATTDTSMYIQSGLNMTQVEIDASGNWRIFSKLGAGCANDLDCDIAYNGYACLPSVEAESVELNAGVEFVISAWYTKDAGDLCVTDKYVEQNIAPVVKAIVDGSLQ